MNTDTNERARDDGGNHFDHWLTPREAGEYLGMSEWTVRQLARSGEITHAKVTARGKYRFRRQWLDDYMEVRVVESKKTQMLVEHRSAERQRQQQANRKETPMPACIKAAVERETAKLKKQQAAAEAEAKETARAEAKAARKATRRAKAK